MRSLYSARWDPSGTVETRTIRRCASDSKGAVQLRFGWRSRCLPAGHRSRGHFEARFRARRLRVGRGHQPLSESELLLSLTEVLQSRLVQLLIFVLHSVIILIVVISIALIVVVIVIVIVVVIILAVLVIVIVVVGIVIVSVGVVLAG